MFGSSRWGSFRKAGRVVQGSFDFSTPVVGGDGAQVKITRVRRKGSLLSLTQARSHVWFLNSYNTKNKCRQAFMTALSKWSNGDVGRKGDPECNEAVCSVRDDQFKYFCIGKIMKNMSRYFVGILYVN
ncbi:hypothetical protein DITRI_Ditri07aG0098800 [Diplodiscus trichospermus]